MKGQRENEKRTNRERATGGQAFSSAWLGRECERERKRERNDREGNRWPGLFFSIGKDTEKENKSKRETN
jgi:hypothetical protein